MEGRLEVSWRRWGSHALVVSGQTVSTFATHYSYDVVRVLRQQQYVHLVGEYWVSCSDDSHSCSTSTTTLLVHSEQEQPVTNLFGMPVPIPSAQQRVVTVYLVDTCIERSAGLCAQVLPPPCWYEYVAGMSICTVLLLPASTCYYWSTWYLVYK